LNNIEQDREDKRKIKELLVLNEDIENNKLLHNSTMSHQKPSQSMLSSSTVADSSYNPLQSIKKHQKQSNASNSLAISKSQ